MALTHLIVGAGNMGGALLSGWLRDGLLAPRSLAVLDPSPGTEAVFAIERGARHLTGPSEIPKGIGTVLLAVKPQLYPRLRSDLAAVLGPGTLVVSIMAGIKLARLAADLPDCHVVRAMPNTPAAIGRGVSAFVAGADVPSDAVARAEALLAASGTVLRLQDDAQIDAVTAISGSGPAYVFHLVEALEASAKALGLAPDVAAALARQTVIGASALLEASERDAAELREAVTSPGGTTQAALEVLMGENGLSALMREATRAAADRSRALSR